MLAVQSAYYVPCWKAHCTQAGTHARRRPASRFCIQRRRNGVVVTCCIQMGRWDCVRDMPACTYKRKGHHFEMLCLLPAPIAFKGRQLKSLRLRNFCLSCISSDFFMNLVLILVYVPKVPSTPLKFVCGNRTLSLRFLLLTKYSTFGLLPPVPNSKYVFLNDH